MAEERIFAEDLSKQFDEFWAVDGISFQVQAGKVMVLLGPNGAGKTTTVRMLTSILKPTRGQARVAGYDVVRQPEKVRGSVGVLTEHHGLYSRMSSVEYLVFYGELYGLKPRVCKERIDLLLDQFGLDFARKKRLGEYSKGMRQKLALVRAMLHDPPILLLDEPTSAMDPESARMVRDAIQKLRSAERTIVLCTHNLAEAEELADQIAIIRQGKIILEGDLQEVKAELMGPPEYDIRLAGELNGQMIELPEGVTLIQKGSNWLRVRVPHPESDNPRLLRRLLDLHLEVFSLHEVPRSLEQVYMHAMGQPEGRP